MKIKCSFSQMQQLFGQGGTGAYTVSSGSVKEAWHQAALIVIELNPKPAVATFLATYPAFTEVEDISA